jgi:hypothetical protein
MAQTAENNADAGVGRFIMLCLRCDRPVVTRVAWVGREVQCPHCSSVLRVPPPANDGSTVRARGPDTAPKRFFNFACPRCECLLEGHTGMCGQLGTCPTCAARFTVPFLRPGSNLPDKARLVEGEMNDPTPMHAYAASGDQAPKIISDGERASIECPRCGNRNEIDADRCRSCSAPFTMEAAPTIGRINRDSRAVASVTLGVIGLLLAPTFVPGLLAVWFGLLAVTTPHGPGRSRAGIVGLVLGLLSLGGGVAFWASR